VGDKVIGFYRSGHYRTNHLGHTYWVGGHDVHRYDWHRQSHLQEARATLSLLAASSSRSACFVNPNASCPVCGASVFYYQNELGSRVYFDELGPPWPKHCCTDSTEFSLVNAQLGTSFLAQPRSRNPEERRQIDRSLTILGADVGLAGHPRQGLESGWSLFEVSRRIAYQGTIFLILRSLATGKRKFLSFRRLPKACRDGLILASKKSTISFVHPERCEPLTVEGEKIRGPSDFIDKISGPPHVAE